MGIRGVRIEGPEQFLKGLKDKHPSLTVQALNARFVAGFEHLEMVLQQSWMAFDRETSYSKKLDLEIIVRVACDSQIARALRTVGLKSKAMDIALVAIGEPRALEFFSEAIKGLGEISDDVIELNPKKESFLIKHHKIANELIGATIADNKLAVILAERANLLRI
ncbi:MAG: hypothetical protein HXX80_01345 [Nitrososphaerales archaeon]|nr:hypothetical protein [Nitrososphaerales archaeon]